MSKVNIQSVYLLADHLDAALATGEDMLKENVALARFTPDTPSSDMREAHTSLRDFVERVRMLEMRICARVSRARDLAGAIAAQDQHLEPFATLFASGTVLLTDAMAELGDTTDQDFETGAQALAYLRSRGFIEPDVAGCSDLDGLETNEDLLIAGRIRLGTLLDLVAAFLDTVESHHDIYGDSETQAGDPDVADVEVTETEAVASGQSAAGIAAASANPTTSEHATAEAVEDAGENVEAESGEPDKPAAAISNTTDELDAQAGSTDDAPEVAEAAAVASTEAGDDALKAKDKAADGLTDEKGAAARVQKVGKVARVKSDKEISASAVSDGAAETGERDKAAQQKAASSASDANREAPSVADAPVAAQDDEPAKDTDTNDAPSTTGADKDAESEQAAEKPPSLMERLKLAS